MSVQELRAPERAAEKERRTSFLELFFDLVFVFAITQVTTLIAEDATPGGFARGALVLGLVWWAWSGYAWMTNAIDVEDTRVRVAMLGATLGSFFLALGVPGAFADDGLWFALPYFAIRVLNVALYARGLRGDSMHLHALLLLAPWFLTAPAVALAGGFVDDTNVRAGIWLASLAIDVTGTLFAASTGFRVSASHFAERYGLFMIIALGESIVAIGLTASELERDTTYALAVAIAFSGAAALWWAYFDFVQLAAERVLRFASEERRAPLARDTFTFLHFPAVLGIILYAVAAKKTVGHPEDPLSTAGRWALGLGLGLYLLAAAAWRYRAVLRIAYERIAASAAIALACVLLADLAAMWLVATTTAVVLAATVAESLRLAEVRARQRSDGPPLEATRRRRRHEAGDHDQEPGDGVEDEVVARHDDRQ